MKFGGASVKNAAAVRNVAKIIQEHLSEQPLVIVVSAMDKTTNALEKLAQAATCNQATETIQQLEQIRTFHETIVNELFDSTTAKKVNAETDVYFNELQRIIDGILLLGDFPNRIYDRIMAFGELISSVIVFHYLRQSNVETTWLDARTVIKTDASFKHAEVVWNTTLANIQNQIKPLFKKYPVVLTQGYIASTTDEKTTTLGREGSDFTASILAAGLEAKKVIVWKDVPGVLSADPKKFPTEAVKIPELNYAQAIEMTFYGASVIHPKTLKPLYNQQIPLYVKYFLDTREAGTVISNRSTSVAASKLVKSHQVLLNFQPRDFSFVEGRQISTVLAHVESLGLQVNLIQTSAISLTLCVDESVEGINNLISLCSDSFHVTQERGLSLQTLLHSSVKELSLSSEKRLIQADGERLHVVMKDK